MPVGRQMSTSSCSKIRKAKIVRYFYHNNYYSFLVEDDGSVERDAASVSSSAGSALTPREQIVKSPPEPTRVKSPEQIIMRSPDPVNWTVPLDTGKTFTVTQNVREGEIENSSKLKTCLTLHSKV